MFDRTQRMTDRLAYTTRYVYADTTVSSHGGSAGNVYIKSEEHARLQQMANHLERCCNDLHAAGYDVIAITPISSGRVGELVRPGELPVGSGGYSVTDGLIVTGRLRS